MTPFPLVLTDPVPEALPSVLEDKPSLTIILMIDPEQNPLFSHHLTSTIDATTRATYEGSTLKLTIKLIDQT